VQPLGSSQQFMEPEGSLPSSQELSTCTYPEPDESSPQHSILSLKGPSYITHIYIYINLTVMCINDRLCGLVVRVSGYRSRVPGFYVRGEQIF
jgi:hypothetical protein